MAWTEAHHVCNLCDRSWTHNDCVGHWRDSPCPTCYDSPEFPVKEWWYLEDPFVTWTKKVIGNRDEKKKSEKRKA